MRLHHFSVLILAALAAPSLPAQQTPAGAGLPAPSAADSAAVNLLLDSLPLPAMVAQLVMPWIPGGYAAFDDSAFAVTQRWVDSFGIGGIIVSVGSPLDVAAKLNQLQRRASLPLLVAADLESGAGFRLAGATAFPPNMGVAATGSEEDAYTVGRITAIEGRAVGIHLTFSPVADVNNNPANPIINVRSFGEDPYRVSLRVAAAIRGLQQHGMAATAKHFPGHGDTDADSHLQIPRISADWYRLDTLELVPFRAAVQAGVSFVMSGHLVFPAAGTDGRRPATLDPVVLTTLLRDSLGFRGLVVTDALDMAAIAGRYGAGEAAVLAFLAGADLLLQPSSPGAAVSAVTSAVETGRIPFERLAASVRRLLLLKRQLGLFRSRTVALDSVQGIVGNQHFLDSARAVARRAVVLAADDRGVVDSLRAAPRAVALITYGEENAATVGNGLLRELRAAGHRVTLFRLWPASGPASYDSAWGVIRRNPYTVLVAAVKATAGKGSVALPEAVADLFDGASRRRRAVVVSLGSPYLVAQIPHLGSYLIGWGANGVSEWATGQALTGRAPISGRLPVTLPPRFPLGSGLARP